MLSFHQKDITKKLISVKSSRQKRLRWSKGEKVGKLHKKYYLRKTYNFSHEKIIPYIFFVEKFTQKKIYLVQFLHPNQAWSLRNQRETRKHFIKV